MNNNWELLTVYYGRGSLSQEDYEKGIVDDFVIVAGKSRNEVTMEMDVIFKLIKPFGQNECIANEAIISQEELDIIKKELAEEEYIQPLMEAVQKHKKEYAYTVNALDTDVITVNMEHSEEPEIYSLKSFKDKFL